jgi:hypothetical protein
MRDLRLILVAPTLNWCGRRGEPENTNIKIFAQLAN